MTRRKRKDSAVEDLGEVKALLIQLQTIADLALKKADDLAEKLNDLRVDNADQS